MKRQPHFFTKENIEKFQKEMANLKNPNTEDVIDILLSSEKKWTISDDICKRKAKKVEDIISNIQTITYWMSIKSECVGSQEVQTKQNPNLKKSRHHEVYMYRRELNKKPSKRFYYFEQIFSNPSNYYLLSDDTISLLKENDCIRNLVIDPEFIDDKFLISIWECENDFLKLGELEKLEFKISFIPKLKEILARSCPLKIWDQRYSARITCLQNGKILCFLSLETREDGIPIINNYKKVLVFNDIYSLYRSELYTKDILKEKQESLTLLKEKIMALIDSSSSEKSQDINQKELANIANTLKKWKNYWEQRILIDRLSKIKNTHYWNDISRLTWALNDSYKAYLNRLSQSTSLNIHTIILDWIINDEQNKWNKLYDLIIKNLEDLEEDELINISLNQDNSEWKLGIINKKIDNILKKLRWYKSSKQQFCPFPFSRFYERIWEIEQFIQSSIKESNRKKILNWLLSLNIYLKMQKYVLCIYKIENSIKLDNFKNTQNTSWKDFDIIKEELMNLKDSLLNKNFLPHILVSEKIDKHFGNFVSQIDKMLLLLKENNLNEFVKYITNLRTNNFK